VSSAVKVVIQKTTILASSHISDICVSIYKFYPQILHFPPSGYMTDQKFLAGSLGASKNVTIVSGLGGGRAAFGTANDFFTVLKINVRDTNCYYREEIHMLDLF
jgi:hypothetical protein